MAVSRNARRARAWLCSIVLVAIGLWLATLGSPAPARAQATPETAAEAAPVVGRILVRGNLSIDSLRIARSSEILPGARFSRDMIKRAIRKLYALGLFSDVQVFEDAMVDGRQDVRIEVRERPRIASVKFSGNAKRETADLEKKLFLRSGETYSPVAVATQVDSLLLYYKEEGFTRASVQARVDTLAELNQVALTFVVAEGEKVRVTRIVFSGAPSFSEGRLRKAMKTRKKGFFGGGEVKDESFSADREALLAFYRNHGYRDAEVTGFELEPGNGPRALTLKVGVREGRLHRLGDVRWSGGSVVKPEVLAKLWSVKPGELYDRSRIERAQGEAYAEYSESGYLYVNVDPRESTRDSLVDVTFVVTEGQPSHVRRISIVGNKGTREKVIRREIDIHEGDRFRRSALMRSRDDAMRLGLFEQVIPDFSPAESTDVDLVFRVTEKQVGTASAGAGYTNESGLTGFLELGHNNVLGNGQALQLHLERGGRREDYSVSFTEPWFRDTPTLLGFSAYNSQRDRDLYDERRAGGSARIGRPLPWPDYSRGSMSFSLENVTLRSRNSILTAEDSLVLAGVTLGRPILTSSLQTSFSRNSTDNPFYPTKGTRLTVTDEFAGGPFGGSVHFHKHRIEGRAYLPSVVKGVTTMLRLRVGLLGEYGDQTQSVPNYERFRLGGGNTPDPLRGYEDYQIVPEKFVRDIVTKTYIRDTSGVVTDSTTFTTRVRYPGGRTLGLFSLEQQFPIVNPLRGVIFFDAGNVWDLWREIKPFDLKVGAGLGFRMEIPILGNIGFDYGYGFNRDDKPGWQGHFLLGNVNF